MGLRALAIIPPRPESGLEQIEECKMGTLEYVNDNRFTNVRPQVTQRERIEGAMSYGRAKLGDDIDRQILRRQGYYGKTLPDMVDTPMELMRMSAWF